MQNVFESQLLGTGKFKGNVRVDALVYMPFPEGMGEKRQKEKDNHYYRNNPSVAGMMRALEGVCGDLLFEKDTVIVAMSMEKRWSVDPRLEMIISEVGLYEREEDKKEKKGSD
jgi:Holliday junction resolvase RusA-like endonuclease